MLNRRVSLPALLLCSGLFVLGYLPPIAAFGQSATATLSGTVTDQQGRVLPDVGITVSNKATGQKRKATTNGEGYFTVAILPPSTYTVKAERDGFAPLEIDDIVLNVNDQRALQIQMKVGNVTDTVTIKAESGIEQSGTVATVVDRQFVENLPLNGRTIQSLIALTPGVTLTKPNGNDEGQFSVNGQRPDANYFMIDGVSANIGVNAGIVPGQSAAGSTPGLNAFGGTNDLVSIDALQEFKVLTSTYAPEFGRTPGAQVSIVTRSGSNVYHGSVFDYLRNDVFDANDWFANQHSLKKAALRQNDFGGVVGGPIIKNRTFFFFSYEGLRLRLPQVGVASVPSLAARASAPAAIRPFLDAYPIPNGPVLSGDFAQVSASFSDPSSLNAASVRIDHTLDNGITVFGRYNYAPSETVTRGVNNSLNTVLTTSLNTQTVTGGGTVPLGKAILADVRVNFSRNSGLGKASLDSFDGAVPPGDPILFPGASSRTSFLNFIVIGGTNSNFEAGQFGNNIQRQFNLVGTLSVTRGAHQLKVGADYRRLFPVIDFFRSSVGVAFLGIDQLLSGKAFVAGIQAVAGPRFPIFTNVSLFAQDTWEIGTRLTLTYGVRWDVNPPPSESNGNLPAALVGVGSPATLNVAAPGTPQYHTTYRNFAPRVGVAYRLFQKPGRETVFRGGFGLFYDLGYGSAGAGFGFSGFPNVVSKLIFNVPFPLDQASLALPPVSRMAPFGQILGGVDPTLKLPYTYQWNATLEQALGPNQTLAVSYVGAVGRRLLRQEELLRPNPNFTSTVDITRNASTSDYHALQMQFQRRLSGRLQALLAYTWSHSLDNASSDSSFEIPLTKESLQNERGPSNFDVRHAFNAALTYDIPAVRSREWIDAMSRNWSIDGIFRTRSPTPVNVITGVDVFGTGFFGGQSARPDLVVGVPLYVDDPSVAGGRRINSAAFVIPTGRQGTLGRNALQGFGMWQADIAVRREFHVRERLRLQLRAEAFNVFNHPNFGDPGVNGNGTNMLTNPQFGQSISMLSRSLGASASLGSLNPLYQVGGPRSLQLAAKFVF